MVIFHAIVNRRQLTARGREATRRHLRPMSYACCRRRSSRVTRRHTPPPPKLTTPTAHALRWASQFQKGSLAAPLAHTRHRISLRTTCRWFADPAQLAFDPTASSGPPQPPPAARVLQKAARLGRCARPALGAGSIKAGTTPSSRRGSVDSLWPAWRSTRGRRRRRP